MQQENEFTITEGRDLYRLVGYSVVDRNDSRVGSVEDIWEDASNQPAFLAIKTGWLGLGRTHIVPAQNSEVNDYSRAIRLPYEESALKNAPHFESASDIDPEMERQIYDYYGGYGFAATQGHIRDWTGSRSTEADTDTIREGSHESAGSARSGEEGTIQLKEEELRVGKREVEAGGVRLRKVVRSEVVNQPVELKREEIEIERVPGGNAKPSDASFQERDIYIPLRREEPVVTKDTRVSEEIRAQKRTVSDREEISESVRKEDIEIDESDADLADRDRRS